MDKKEEKKKQEMVIKGLDIDKAEYEAIVLSNSNFPDRDYFQGEWKD